MPGLDALIPRSQYSLRSGSPVYGPDGQIGTVAPIEAVLGKAGANGMYFDGVDDHLTMADSAAQAIGVSDFALYFTVAISDYTPSATKCLFSKISGNTGIKVNLTTAGLLQLQIGNGTNFTTYSYSSTVAVPTADYHVASVGVEADRDGNATLVWNGSKLGDAVDMSGSAAQSATAAATAYLMRDGSTYTQGRLFAFHFLNYCPDAATRLRYYMTGVPDSDKWASFVPIIDASTLNGGFETAGGGGADVFGSWSETASGTSTVNDDTLAPYAGTHACRFDMGAADNIVGVYQTPLTTGKRFRAAAYMKGSVAGKIAAYVFGSAVSLSHTLTTSYARYASEAIADATQLTIKRLNAASSSIYVDNVTVEQIGCVVCLDGSVQSSVRSATWYDQSTNAINATVSGATLLLTRRSQPSTVETWDSSGNPSAQAFETGSWTPALSFDTPGDLSVTYTTQVGRYWRTGSLVVAVCDITTSAFTHTTAAGDFRINGLPYAAGAVASYAYPCGNVMDFTAMTQPGVDLVAYPTASTYIRIGSRAANGTRTVISVTQVTTGVNRTLRVTLAYQV